MTKEDIKAGVCLRLYDTQVFGCYVEAHELGKEIRTPMFAVSGIYEVVELEKYHYGVNPAADESGTTTIVRLRSKASGQLFECTLYHLGAILGEWSWPPCPPCPSIPPDPGSAQEGTENPVSPL